MGLLAWLGGAVSPWIGHQSETHDTLTLDSIGARNKGRWQAEGQVWVDPVLPTLEPNALQVVHTRVVVGYDL